MINKEQLTPSENKAVRCDNVVGSFTGIKRGEIGQPKYKAIRTAIRCKQWDCAYCRKKNAKILYKRMLKGIGNQMQNVNKRYSIKLLTLTVPGETFRKNTNQFKAQKIISSNFSKLIKAIKKTYGKFDYVRIVEAQGDGYPHYHVLMVGDNIAPKSVLDKIDYLWRTKYKMGFVRINAIKGIKKTISYVIKYITKGKEINLVYKMRTYSGSRGILEKVPIKKKWLKKIIGYGKPDKRILAGYEEYKFNSLLDREIEWFLLIE